MIRTERLILRDWRESDTAPWAAMNADPEVRQFLGPPLTSEQAAAWAINYQDDLDRYGYGYWALEVRATGEFIGFAGLAEVDEEMPYAGIGVGVDCGPGAGVDIAWRLTRSAWGRGYATEAGLAVLGFGFGELRLPEIVSVTMARNVRSQAVMQRIGMTTDPSWDFDDPDVEDLSLRRHVVYRRLRGAWS